MVDTQSQVALYKSVLLSHEQPIIFVSKEGTLSRTSFLNCHSSMPNYSWQELCLHLNSGSYFVLFIIQGIISMHIQTYKCIILLIYHEELQLLVVHIKARMGMNTFLMGQFFEVPLDLP